MATYRQVQLRLNGEQNPTTVDLNTSPYKVAAGTWRSGDARLEVGVVIQATTLAALDRTVAILRQLMTLAEAYDQGMHVQPVYVYQKTCDALATTAEIGATWLRKRVSSGQVHVPDPSELADGNYTVTVTLTMDVVEVAWQRAAPAQILSGDGGSSTRVDGGITQAQNTTLTARRINWSATTGMTVRVFWVYSPAGSAQVHFFRDSSNVRLFWGGAAVRFYITDADGNICETPIYSFASGQVIEIIGVWSLTRMAVYVNGVLAVEKLTEVVLSNPSTFTVLAPDTGAGSQSIVSWQLWPTPLSNAESLALRAWGQPDPQLAYAIAPASTELTAFYRSIYNVPGEMLAPMRVIVNGSADFDQLLVHLRLLNAPSTPVWECESGTLGIATATISNSAASGGSQAQFTPTTTGFATRVTLTLAADPDDVDDLLGKHRLYLAAYDGAAATNTNLVRWRLIIAGVAEDWSDEYALAAVATRSLIDLGTLEIPPGAWPDEALYATTDVVGGGYVTLEIQVSNTIGSGGGTFDLDAVYLAPAEMELAVVCTDFSFANQYIVVDFVSEHFGAITARSLQSLEFATWGQLTGDVLMLAPRAGLSAFLWMYGLRDTSQQALPRDSASAYLFYRPRYL